MDYATALDNMPEQDADDTGIWKQDNYEAIRSALELAIKVESGEYVLLEKSTGKYFVEGDSISMDKNGKVIVTRSEAATKGTRG